MPHIVWEYTWTPREGNLKWLYYIVDRNRTNNVLFLTKNHWVDDSHKHRALSFPDTKEGEKEAEEILRNYLRNRKLSNKWGLYRVEKYPVAD